MQQGPQACRLCTAPESRQGPDHPKTSQFCFQLRRSQSALCRYEVSFIRNAAGELVSDRRFNTSSILATYLGPDAVGADRIAWDVDNPNRLKLSLPGMLLLAGTLCRGACLVTRLDLGMVPGLQGLKGSFL